MQTDTAPELRSPCRQAEQHSLHSARHASRCQACSLTHQQAVRDLEVQHPVDFLPLFLQHLVQHLSLLDRPGEPIKDPACQHQHCWSPASQVRPTQAHMVLPWGTLHRVCAHLEGNAHDSPTSCAGMVHGMQWQDQQTLSKPGALFAAEMAQPCQERWAPSQAPAAVSTSLSCSMGGCFMQLARKRNLELGSCADGTLTPLAESLLHTAPVCIGSPAAILCPSICHLKEDLREPSALLWQPATTCQVYIARVSGSPARRCANQRTPNAGVN